MKLGEFRKFTEALSDDTDIVIQYVGGRVDDDGYVDIPMMNVRLEEKENVWLGDEYSDKVIYVAEPDYY